MVEDLVREMADSDPKKALKWAKATATGEARIEAIADLGRELAESDMDAAKQILDEIPRASRMRERVAGWVARDLARRDVKGALKWAKSLKSREAKERALRHVVHQWAAKDPDKAFAFARDFSKGRRQEMIQHVGRRVARRKPKKVMEWADKVESKDAKQELMSSGLGELINRHPGQAQERLQEVEDPTLRSEVTEEVVDNLAREAPRKATQLVKKLPAGEKRADAIENMAREWSSYNPKAAAEWAKELPPGEGRDAAIEPVVRRFAESSPKVALAWAKSIGNRE